MVEITVRGKEFLKFLTHGDGSQKTNGFKVLQTPTSRGYPRWKPYAGKSGANNYVEMRKICTIAWVGRYNA